MRGVRDLMILWVLQERCLPRECWAAGPTQDTELVICETNTSNTCSPLEKPMVSPTLEQLPFSGSPTPNQQASLTAHSDGHIFHLFPRAP